MKRLSYTVGEDIVAVMGGDDLFCEIPIAGDRNQCIKDARSIVAGQMALEAVLQMNGEGAVCEDAKAAIRYYRRKVTARS